MHDLADTATVSNITYRAKAGKVVQKDVDTANALVQLSVDFEKKHHDIIKRLWRYPHRTEAPRRKHTAKEKEYLESRGGRLATKHHNNQQINNPMTGKYNFSFLFSGGYKSPLSAT